ncbi:hypothetical protein BTUL_0037g00510 [Botrytis tulipae]|uniref:Uncharacterized protein n=1 Tax=Botrytis tulipae TaxID=87230 RepID=A0A4Z1EW89_9HELO|nr:hypothetical protein BTUL_0037g00510 [Botrytis tulipae]
MSSTLVEADEPQENQKSSGLDGSIDDDKTSKSGEDSDQEGKSKSTENFQKASESAQDNEATTSAGVDQNTATKVMENQTEEAAGIEENRNPRSNGYQNGYPKTADDEIRDLKRRILDLETKFIATSRAIVRSKPDHDEGSDSADEENKMSENGVEVEKYPTPYSSPRSRSVDYHNSREQKKTISYRDFLRDDYKENLQRTIHIVPKLNLVKWKNFKSSSSQLDEIYAIDVLVGEPDITFEGDHDNIWDRTQANRGVSPRKIGYIDQRTTSQPSAKPLVAGQAALPERIRINSKNVIRILSKIHGRNFSDGRTNPVLLFRPFKALIFYEEEIRTRYTALNAKFGKKTAIFGDPEPKDLSTTVDSDGQPPSTIIEGRSNESAKKTEAESTSNHSPEADSLDLNSEAAFNELSCLIEFIDHYIKYKQRYLARSSCQKVAFSDIWHLFKPGNEVMEGKLPQAYQVISVHTKKHKVKRSQWHSGFKRTIDYGPVTIDCVCIDCDGKRVGPVSKRFTIQQYEGEHDVTSLPVYPLRFAKEMNREGLVARGQLFLETAVMKHMHCSGLTLDTRDEVDSQVMIDFEEALLQHEYWTPFIENLADSSPESETKEEEEDDGRCYLACCENEECHDDSYAERNRKGEFIESQHSAVSRGHSSLTIVPRSLQEVQGSNLPSQDELLIMSYRVFGFILRSRKWAKLNLGDITEARRVDDENGFDQLVLPKGHKDMVKCLIRQHFREKESKLADKDEMDIVRGKGDLGSEAAEVEAALETNFSLANRWGCILLIDEADIFLAERTRHDFLRNAVVAVFLRVLEYYAGILFLTTNRVGAFDEAFTSRIHVSLYYPQLNWNSTLEIFKMNMQRVKDRFAKRNINFKIDEADIGAFARSYYDENGEGRWNGRQIRNAFQTALALAEYDAQGDGDSTSLTDNINKQVILKGSHFETVSEAYLGFVNYMKEVNHGVSMSKRALDRSYRDDEFGELKSPSWSGLELRRGGVPPIPPVTSDPRHPSHQNFRGDRRQQFARTMPSGVPVSNHEQSYQGNHYQDPGLNPNYPNSGDRRQPQPMELNHGNDFLQNAYSSRETPNDRRDLGWDYTTSSERGMRTAQYPSQLHQDSQAWSTSDRIERKDSSNYASYPSGPSTFGMERRGFYPENKYDNQSGLPSRGIDDQRTNAGGFQNATNQGQDD